MIIIIMVNIIITMVINIINFSLHPMTVAFVIKVVSDLARYTLVYRFEYSHNLLCEIIGLHSNVILFPHPSESHHCCQNCLTLQRFSHCICYDIICLIFYDCIAIEKQMVLTLQRGHLTSNDWQLEPGLEEVSGISIFGV